MPFQNLPRSAESYTREQRREIAAALLAVRRQWRRMGTGDFDASYSLIEPGVLGVATVAQQRIAEGATAYVPAVMAETGQRVRDLGTVVTSSLVSVAGDGRPVGSLLYGSVVRSRTALGAGASPAQALRSGGQWLTMAVGTLLSDTGRAAEKVAMAAHGAGGYVRMLVPPSCSRCAILAGRVYSDSEAFQRHPRCDCRHIPATESVARELTVDPREYFDSLTETEQADIFTVDGAEAIRNGADPAQVVNARRGMRPAQVGGRNVLVTGRRRNQRLMPESLRAAATDRADFVRLLRANGYIR